MALSRSQLKQFRQALLAERVKVAGEIKSIAQETSKSPREASGDLSAYTVHMADMSADAYEREVSMNIVSSEQEVLYQIDDALKRMEEGSLTEEEVERLGEALMDLDAAIEKIKMEQGVVESVKAVRDGLDRIVDEAIDTLLNPRRLDQPA